MFGALQHSPRAMSKWPMDDPHLNQKFALSISQENCCAVAQMPVRRTKYRVEAF